MIYMQVPNLPPTSNNAYYDQIFRKGKDLVSSRKLSPEGEKYKTETSNYFIRTYPQEMKFFYPNSAYGMVARYNFKQIVNKTWPKGTKTRYKKLDASNRHKLFEDSIAAAGGIDDSQFLFSAPSKKEGPEMTEVWVWNMDQEVPYELFQIPGLWSL